MATPIAKPATCEVCDMEIVRTLRSRVRELEEGLEFYADPATYFAIGFFPDPPCGDFLDDFEDTELGRKPGKLARALLDASTKEVMPHTAGPPAPNSTPAPVVTSAAGAAFMLPTPEPATPIPQWEKDIVLTEEATNNNVPDRWDAEAGACVAVEPDGQIHNRDAWRVVLVVGDQRSTVIRLSVRSACDAYAEWLRTKIFVPLARRAYREGLEHARGVALDAAGEYPEDIFRPIEPGELADAGSLGDRIGAHMARVAARNIAAAIRREIEGA